ncbi:MAG TPA: NAD(P)-dependent oxidoreductase [bacterium]|nr:NAD(P)-dependent oxidoreductase [bacterium]HPN46164.1 NAD(P)-dependent oxidoreductase [bacterium]
MSKVKEHIVILDGGYESYHYEITRLTDNGYVLDFYNGRRDDIEQRLAFARNAVGMFVRGSVIDYEFLRQLPRLKAIVRYGVGYNNVDLLAASRLGIKVANVQGYANHSVSDHALALMYACLRALPAGQRHLHSAFSKPPTPNIFELHDKTVGIIGLGRIGGMFCAKVRNLCRQVLAVDPNIPADRFIQVGATACDFNTILRESNVISIHCDLNPSSARLFNDHAFQLLTKKPILINTSRGEVLDETALYRALESGLLHSAGLDVFCHEPAGEEQALLLEHPQVIATGHYAWYSQTAAQELQKRATENMLNLLNNRYTEDWLNP